jgi:8-oxo-dGTP pyrophosphatase MutT (NUDIX family)
MSHSQAVVQRVSMKAVMVCDGKILLLRKAMYAENGGKEGKWNNPGGRVEVGEHWQDALKREVLEETGIKDFSIEQPIFVGEWTPVIQGVPTQIICTFLLCKTDKNTVKLDHEHDDYRWVGPDDYQTLDILTPEKEVLDKAFTQLALA